MVIKLGPASLIVVGRGDSRGKHSYKVTTLAELTAEVLHSFQSNAELLKQDAPPGGIVQEQIFYVMIDKALTKEKVTQLIETQIIEKEFLKQSHLVKSTRYQPYTELIYREVNKQPEIKDVNMGAPKLLQGGVNSSRIEQNLGQDAVKDVKKAHSQDANGFPKNTANKLIDPGMSLLTTSELNLLDEGREDPNSGKIAQNGEKHNSVNSADGLSIKAQKSTQSNSSGNTKANPFKQFVQPGSNAVDAAQSRALVPMLNESGNVNVPPNSGKHEKNGHLAKKDSKKKSKSGFRKLSLRWCFSSDFTAPDPQRISSQASNPNDGKTPSQAPTLQPFLNQSVSNSNLDSTDIPTTRALNNTQKPPQPSISIPETPSQRSEKMDLLSNTTTSEKDQNGPAKSVSETGKNQPIHVQTYLPQGRTSNSESGTELQRSSGGLTQPKFTRSGSQRSSPRILQNASSFRESDTPGGLWRKSADLERYPVEEIYPVGHRSTVKLDAIQDSVMQASYRLALENSPQLFESDKQIAAPLEPYKPHEALFYQLEEHRIFKERIDTFIEHQTYLLEYVMQIKFLKEVKRPSYRTVFSRQKFNVTKTGDLELIEQY